MYKGFTWMRENGNNHDSEKCTIYSTPIIPNQQWPPDNTWPSQVLCKMGMLYISIF